MWPCVLSKRLGLCRCQIGLNVENMDLFVQRPIKFLPCFILMLILLIFNHGFSLAEDRLEMMGDELKSIDHEIQRSRDRMDQLAKRSEEVSREVQSLKSKGRLGMIDRVRMERLLSGLREVLLERRDLTEIELQLNTKRKKQARLFHDQLGDEIKRLLAEAEIAVQKGDARLADQIHNTVLSHMEKRQGLMKRKSPHIPVLPEVEVPVIEGISSEKKEEIAILLKNDAESLEKTKNDLLDERDFLRKELEVKQSLSRFQGFPRGLEDQSIEQQVQTLKEKISLFEQAILEHASTIRMLLKQSEEVMKSAQKQEADLLK